MDVTINETEIAELEYELQNAAGRVAEILRLFENRSEKEAYDRLARLLESIRLFYALFSEDLGWADAGGAEISRKELSAVLERALFQLIAAQENHYWVSICDVLEYEITPILESWQKLVVRTREQLN
jgi:hypothetical protein